MVKNGAIFSSSRFPLSGNFGWPKFALLEGRGKEMSGGGGGGRKLAVPRNINGSYIFGRLGFMCLKKYVIGSKSLI